MSRGVGTIQRLRLLAAGVVATAALLVLPHAADADFIRSSGLGAPEFKRIIVFGDSLSDTGNLAQRTSRWTEDGQRSYSHPAPPPRYTWERFTCGKDTKPPSALDGLVWHEILAKCLKLEPAGPSLRKGSNYAFGGAVTGGGRRYAGLVDNMELQVEDFLKAGKAKEGDLYLVWGGGNDLIDAATGWSAKAEDVKKAGEKAIRNLGVLIQKLVTNGAKSVLWPNLPPLDQTPRGSKLKQELREALKSASEAFAKALMAQKAELEQKNKGIELLDLDVFREFGRMVRKEGKYKVLENTTDPAQREDVDPDKYIFWDELHPTAQVHRWLGEFACERIPEPAALLLACLCLLFARTRRRAAV